MIKITKRALALTKTQLAEEQKLDSMIAGIPDATGIKNRDIADRIVCQVGGSLLSPSPQTADSRLIKAIGAEKRYFQALLEECRETIGRIG